jgi:hypothetical protein
MIMILVETIHGSHLYGTNTETSDRDYKRVVIPSAESILLQKAKDSSRETTKTVTTAKNTQIDEDTDIWSLQKFFSLCVQGQTNALEVLFTPAQFTIRSSPEWEIIVHNRHRIISRKIGAFLGYCQQQAAKYGIKGSRVAAMEKAAKMLTHLYENYHVHCKLGEFMNHILDLTSNEHIEIIEIKGQSGALIPHLKVCETKVPLTIRLKDAQEIYIRCWNQYGERARQAQSNEGIDWKALSHAVRVGHQAVELLETGWLQFPRPERFHLLHIKQGKVAYNIVAQEIEALVDDVRSSHAKSTLPDEPDLVWMNEQVLQYYGDEVAKWMHSTRTRDGSSLL